MMVFLSQSDVSRVSIEDFVSLCKKGRKTLSDLDSLIQITIVVELLTLLLLNFPFSGTELPRKKEAINR